MGVLVIMLSILGCVGAKRQSKPLLLCYGLVMLVLFILQVVATAQVFDFGYWFKDQTQLNSLRQNAIFNNILLSTYTSCCSGCPKSGSPCNQAQPYFNFTLANCQGAGCKLVYPCNSTLASGCYVFDKSEEVVIPAYPVDNSTCAALSSVVFNGAGIVGPVSKGSCGQGDPVKFANNIYMYVAGLAFSLGTAFAVFATCLGLVVVASGKVASSSPIREQKVHEYAINEA